MNMRRGVIGKRIKEARLRAGLSQKNLGIKAGIDQFAASTRINYYERDKTHPPFPIAERLARVLNVPTPYLYAREDELANWILAYNQVSARERRAIAEKGQAAGSQAGKLASP
jgi:transcriptional regulator with XRE-family HTH domain